MLAGFITGQPQSAQRAAVLYDVASEAPKSQAELFRQTFEKLGGSVVAFETYTTGDRDFSAQLTKIQSANPDVVFLPAYYNDVGLIAQQARRQGMNQTLIGSDAWSSPELVKLAQGSVEGAYFANHYAADIATPTAREFIAAYQQKYGKTPDDVAALTYDAMGLVVPGLEDRGCARAPGGARCDGGHLRLYGSHRRYPLRARFRRPGQERGHHAGQGRPVRLGD